MDPPSDVPSHSLSESVRTGNPRADPGSNGRHRHAAIGRSSADLESGQSPLFPRESIARKLVDEGTISDRNDYSDQPMDLGVMRIPDTVSGMISERIDRLPQAAKELLLTASVLGNEFELKIVSGNDRLAG